MLGAFIGVTIIGLLCLVWFILVLAAAIFMAICVMPLVCWCAWLEPVLPKYVTRASDHVSLST